MVDPIPDPATWPPTVEFRREDSSRDRHLAALREVLAFDPPKVSRGIVWVGGGAYWPGIVTGVRLLREVGCTLPVEVWYRGSCEPVDPVQVAGMGVTLIDSDRMADALGDNRVIRGVESWGGWENKLYALTHTRLEQVLYLDADAYCVADPLPLFALLSQAEPFLFWHDLPGVENNVRWPRVWPDGDAGVPSVQGGQLLIDTRHAKRLLAVAHWMCQHSDYYFAWLYGDQDTWRVALAAGACGWRCLGAAPWRDVAFVCPWQGREYIVHRCRGKLFPEIDPKPCPSLPLESRVFEHFAAMLQSQFGGLRER